MAHQSRLYLVDDHPEKLPLHLEQARLLQLFYRCGVSESTVASRLYRHTHACIDPWVIDHTHRQTHKHTYALASPATTKERNARTYFRVQKSVKLIWAGYSTGCVSLLPKWPVLFGLCLWGVWVG